MLTFAPARAGKADWLQCSCCYGWALLCSSKANHHGNTEHYATLANTHSDSLPSCLCPTRPLDHLCSSTWDTRSQRPPSYSRPGHYLKVAGLNPCTAGKVNLLICSQCVLWFTGVKQQVEDGSRSCGWTKVLQFEVKRLEPTISGRQRTPKADIFNRLFSCRHPSIEKTEGPFTQQPLETWHRWFQTVALPSAKPQFPCLFPVTGSDDGFSSILTFFSHRYRHLWAKTKPQTAALHHSSFWSFTKYQLKSSQGDAGTIDLH